MNNIDWIKDNIPYILLGMCIFILLYMGYEDFVFLFLFACVIFEAMDIMFDFEKLIGGDKK